MNIQQAIQATVDGVDLAREDAADAMREIMSGEATPAQFGAFVTALRMKGETASEIAGMASVMREVSLHIDTDPDTGMVDTCGTGGSGLNWFNISTASAFVVAGAGVQVAKHGNRAMSGSSGSADVLEALGVNIGLGPDGVKNCITEAGIGFMFAQAFHPAMKFAGPLRPQIGIRTIFNFLGPLTNPAGATRQVVGVSDAMFTERIARALEILGTEYAFVVHAESGGDEVDIEGHTLIYQVNSDGVKRRRTRPADFGLPEGRREHLVADSVEHSAEIVRGIFAGAGGGHNAPVAPETSRRNVVVLNAATALLATGKAAAFQEASAMAQDSIDSGAAQAKLDALARVSQEQS
ncbi:MAG: anthranilate phosphoribosyltransferase [Dehalococcoidia bacterium]|jgi:anthranilate phosphoribosyltransferase|nr:anthranilate phosphoribosyltransferase [Dehalococcoidia bacterium]